MTISIVIPAYNEERRLPIFLTQVIGHVRQNNAHSYEIIIVDDGSRDNTSDVVTDLIKKHPDIQLKLLRLEANKGKGGAVKAGLLNSNGDIGIFLDADGSVHPSEIENNIHYLQNDNFDIFIGSRVLKNEQQVLKVKWYRKIFGVIFNHFVQFFLFKQIKDTQCGFKMFKKSVIPHLFSRVYLNGFGFDIEVLYLAYKMGYRVKEGPVSWHHVNESKVNLIRDSLKMFYNILQIRNWHCTPINRKSEHMGPNEYQYMYEMEQNHWWFTSRRELAVQLLRSLNFTNPKILDVGAGTGGNLLEFSKIGECHGIDVSPTAIDFCHRRGLVNVMLSPAEKLPFPDQSFDVITCLDVIEHVVNPIAVLKEIRRVLKDDGRVIVMVPAFRALWSQHDEALCHLRRYEKNSLISDLSNANLISHKLNYYFMTSFLIVAPIRLLRRVWAKKDKLYSDTSTLPPSFLNKVLKFIFKGELRLSKSMQFPFGTSLYTIASK